VESGVMSLKASYKSTRNAYLTLFFIAAVVIIILAMGITITTLTPAIIFNVLSNLVLLFFSLAACYYWIKYKGLNRWLTLLGIIGVVGFIVLGIIKDKNP
jgi:hypothetical protein